MKIIKVGEHNANILTRIHEECFKRHWSEEDFRKFLQNKCNVVLMMVREEGETLIPMGFILYQQIDKGGDAEVITICTREKYRRHGVAKTLIRSIKSDRLFLEVNENNVYAVNMYKKLGFMVDKVRNKYYNKTDNALLMTKDKR